MKSIVRPFPFLLAIILFLSLTTCILSSSAKNAKLLTPEMHEDLLIGYTLLADTFRDESQLSMLKMLRKLLFRKTVVDEVSATMDKIAASAAQRAQELKRMRKLEPAVMGRPKTTSTIGDAITAAAKEAGTGEMLAWRGNAKLTFNLRFMVLQCQATRMINAMATAISIHDVNTERNEWLLEVAKEYEGYRDDIIDSIRKYIRGEGSAQLDPSWHFHDLIKKTNSIWK